MTTQSPKDQRVVRISSVYPPDVIQNHDARDDVSDINDERENDTTNVSFEADNSSEQMNIPSIDPANFSVTIESIRRRLTIPLYRRMPNTAFGIAMGLASHAILWKTATTAYFCKTNTDSAMFLNKFFWFAAVIVASVVSFLYILKMVLYPRFVRDEWKHPVRVHFCNTPHLVLLLLTIGVPNDFGPDNTTLRAIWGVAFVCQCAITQSVYSRWMFSLNSSIKTARPQFLLSTVGLFMLAVLGEQCDIESAWGLNLPGFCFGAGAMFYMMVVISVFNGLNQARNEKKSPSLFMLFAPPSIAAVALDLMDDDPDTFSDGASMIVGWCLCLCLLLIKIGPGISDKPPTMGTYWAYVFPLASLASLLIRYADSVGSMSARVLAIVYISLATLALIIVLLRMTMHQILVMKGVERWEDPLVDKRYMHKSSKDIETGIN